jgi:hypothetical protein
MQGSWKCCSKPLERCRKSTSQESKEGGYGEAAVHKRIDAAVLPAASLHPSQHHNGKILLSNL